MRLEHLGIIGNCQFSALIESTGSVVWCCFPRLDSEPVFSTLLDEPDGGHFSIHPAAGGRGVQAYLSNTNVLETSFSTRDGSFRVLDFAPRFLEHERSFRPTMLIRVLEPLSGTPSVRVECQPRLGWSKEKPRELLGSNHVRYEGFSDQLRLTTDVPLSYLHGTPFALTERRYLVLTWGEPVEQPLAPMCVRFLGQTLSYWQQWVKHCNIPSMYQSEVIRSALTLKLHCFEDTGAIVASTTTSIPEAPGSGRTWDYRYCWLRDSYYVLSAFRLLGHFEERERFITFLLNVCGNSPALDLAPLYRIDGTSDLGEEILENWRGFDGEGPVRVGNGAALQRQNDVFGEMVLSLAPVFLDDRFREEQSKTTLDLIERLARRAISLAGTPDAGIWEHRTPTEIRTFSSMMCWAAADRAAIVAQRRGLPSEAEFRTAANRIREEILSETWNDALGAFVATFRGTDLDASLLQMPMLRFLSAQDDRLKRSIDVMWSSLAQDGWLLRYRANDGFGVPKVAFLLCTFWLVQALAAVGRVAEARTLFEHTRSAQSPLGLSSEDYEAVSLRMWGNFPQAYSHVGLIHAAFSVSPHWNEVL